MALASTMVFEVRPGSGSDTQAGGGFNSARGGHDYSQQTPAAATGVASSSGTTLTATTAIFTSDMVGNIITNGTNWVEITAFTSTTIVTIDSSPAWTSQTIYVGGAMATVFAVEPLLTAGMIVWIKADGTSQVRTTSFILSGLGSSTLGQIIWNGYHTNRGDNDGTKPLLTTATNSIDMIRCAVNTTLPFRRFNNLEISSTAGTPGNGITAGTGTGFGQEWVISNCYLHGFLNGICGDTNTYNAIENLQLLNTEITACTNDAVMNTDNTWIDSCYLHGNGGYGFEFIRQIGRAGNIGIPVIFRNSAIYGNSLGGIYAQAASASTTLTGPFFDINHCVIVGNTNDGIKHDGANAKCSMISLQNSIIYGNSGYGVNITNVAAMVVLNRNNAYGSNNGGGTGLNFLNFVAGTNDQTLTADPFTARTANDFTLNNAVGGGALCRGNGTPGSIPGLVGVGHCDIGLQQSLGGSTYNGFLTI